MHLLLSHHAGCPQIARSMSRTNSLVHEASHSSQSSSDNRLSLRRICGSIHDLKEKMTEVINNLSKEVNHAVNESLAGVQDYVNITLQKEYYKCGYECFNRNKGEIPRCIERCTAPVERAGAILQNEMQRFQERMQRSMLVCRDRVEMSGGSIEEDEGKIKELEKCMESTVREQIKNLPKLAEHIKRQITTSNTSRI